MSALLAVLWGDRFLGSLLMPLVVHPVVLVGKLITTLNGSIPEACFQLDKPIHGLLCGCLLFLVTVSVSVGTAGCVLMLPSMMLHWWGATNGVNNDATCPNNNDGWPVHFFAESITWCLHVFLLRGSLSLQLLCNVALQMAHFLERGQLRQSRLQLSWLCSRDPSDLRSDELAGATLESLSENLSDSVVSPLFFYVLFGPLGSFAFRVINTLDSRVGYRGPCEWVGKPSARCDDLLNLIPARLTSLLLVLAAALLQVGTSAPSGTAGMIQRALGVAWQDAGQCDSPNAGWPMATFAGILEVRLEKRGQYSLNGPRNGGHGRAPGSHDIRKGHAVAQLAGVLAFLLASIPSVLLS